MSWAARKQFNYFMIVVAFFVLVAVIIIYPQVTKPATCFDNKQNGGEVGTDCGGPCANYCPSQVAPFVVKWSRVFHVSENIYSMVAYVENQNTDASVKSIDYEFRLYDKDNLFIGVREGSTFIAPNTSTAIFEGGFDTGTRVPKRVTFAFTNTPTSVKIPKAYITLPVFGTATVLENTDTLPKLSGTVLNNSLTTFKNLETIAIVYDADGNAIHASKTIIDALGPQSSQPVYFTWREPFAGVAVREEIIPRVNPFTTSL